MKKIWLLAMAAPAVLGACAAGNGEARIEFAKGEQTFDTMKNVVVSYSTIDNMLQARRIEDLKVVYDTIPVKNGVAEFDLSQAGPARYSVELAPQVYADFYAAPGEKIVMKVDAATAGGYTVGGTPLMEGMTEIAALTRPIEQEYRDLVDRGNVTPGQVEAIMNKYDDALIGYIKRNPESPAVAYAMMDLAGSKFMDAYNNLTPAAKSSILMPFVEPIKAKMEEEAKAEAKQNALKSGNTPAPNFTFKDLAGKDVSLSDFKGKWVVIDFWGSWCGWCIKGFPALKEAYKKYEGKLTVIGVACNDTPQAWREAVSKYDLPWVNVYNDQKDGKLYADYGIQGFPTKAIINPEGKIVDITTGEDPSFYNRLAGFLK